MASKEMIYGIIALIIGLMVFGIVTNTFKKATLRNYKKVSVGMLEKVMLETMKGKPDEVKSYQTKKKYIWRIGATRTSNHGYTTYQGVKKVIITVEKGRVTAVEPYNI